MTNHKYLLDSNICIELLRGNNLIKEKALSIDISTCAISVITLIELKVGEELAKANPKKYINQYLDNFLESIDILPIDSAIDLFVKEKVRLQLKGTPIHNNFDLLIGCTAVVNNLLMVTDNTKDFARINNIQLDNWIEHK